MKTCPNCGQTLEDSAKFCGRCGVSLPPPVQPKTQYCPRCGQRMAEGAAFCVSCGASMQNIQRPSQPQASQPMGRQAETSRYTYGSMPPPGPYGSGNVPPPGGTYPPQPGPGVFCPVCGELVAAGSPYCPNCHSPIQTNAPGGSGTMKSNSGKGKAPLFIAAAAVVVVLIVAAVLMVPRLFASPEKTFVTAQQDIFITPLLSAMEAGMDTYGSGKLSTDITLSASVDSAEINRYLSDSSVVLKLDVNQNNLLANGDLVLMGSPVLSGTLTYESGKLGFYLPELDSNYYVVDLSTVLASEGIYVDFSDLKMPEFSGKEWRALAETYLDLVYTVVNENNITTAKRQSFRLPELGGSYTGTIYTFKPTAADVQAVMIKLADHLENDRNLRSLIKKVVDSQALEDALSSGMGYYSGYNDLDSMLDDVLREMAEELRDSAGYMDPTEDLGITWSLYMEGKEVRMVRIVNEYNEAMVFERTGSEAKGCTQTLYEDSYGDTTVYFRNDYTKKGDVYSGKVTMNDGYDESVTVTYSADTGKRSVLGVPYGTYSLDVYSYYEEYHCSMEVSEGKSGSTDHVISIRGGEYTFDGMFSRLDLTINTTDKSSAQKPSQRATDISYYSEYDLENLLYELSNSLENELYYNLYGLW